MSAPVTLVTGLPGNGKTLWSVCFIKEWAEKEKRQVYCNNIEILDKEALPWLSFDPLKWHELPVGAIILFDEAHKVFPVRPVGSRVPPHVEAIGELRHQGHNMVLITQDGMSLDVEIRRRVGRHCQVQRRFGMQACAIFEWSQFKPQASSSRKDVTARHEWVYNKKAYGWYKSAELHTVKRRLPAKLLWLPIAVIAIAVAVYTVVKITTDRMSDPLGSGAAAASSASGASAPAAGGRGGDRPRPLSPAEYVQQFQPRVNGLAYTAPAYDEVTKPVRAPYPAACVQSPSRGCRCYTQQGTRLETPEDLCRSISDGGFFMAWDDGRVGAQQGNAQHVQPVSTAGYTVNSSQASPLSPGHQARNPVRPEDKGGLAVIGANVAQPGSADGETLAWMRQR